MDFLALHFIAYKKSMKEPYRLILALGHIGPSERRIMKEIRVLDERIDWL